MAPMKLLIADGHHRYETALTYRNEHPDDPGGAVRDDDVRQHVLAGLEDPGDASRAAKSCEFHVESLLSKATGDWSVKTFAFARPS